MEETADRKRCSDAGGGKNVPLFHANCNQEATKEQEDGIYDGGEGGGVVRCKWRCVCELVIEEANKRQRRDVGEAEKMQIKHHLPLKY